jgi:hypothetical protein
MRILLLLQLFSTLGMFGLIWFVQIVHYPLFLDVGHAQFAAYEAAHANRTTYVVAPLMLMELVTSLLLLFPATRPDGMSVAWAWVGAALVGVIWASTAFVQVPLHNELQSGYSTAVIGRLVATNWVRTVAWSCRAALVLAWAWRSMGR